MPRTFTFLRLLAALAFFASAYAQPLWAQTQICADEIILNTYQEKAKAVTLRIKNGFSIAGGTNQSFVAESCPNAVIPPPDEPCLLTVSEAAKIRLGQSTPVTASFNCSLAGKAYAFDGVNDYVGWKAFYPLL
jgi:hypothetical protein